MLFFTVAKQSDLTLKPHPEEVDDVKWVSKEELKEMMNDKSLLFSPWFRLICYKWLLPCWWNDLNETMTTNKHCDFVNIHEFDPPVEHLGGGGKAGPMFDSEKKTVANGLDPRLVWLLTASNMRVFGFSNKS